jgi:deoxycytidylate deaminase
MIPYDMRQATKEEISALPYGEVFQNGSLTLFFTSEDNPFLQAAMQNAKNLSLDKNKPNGTVLVKDGVVIGNGANGSDYHNTHECERVRLKIPTGQGYELCEGCHPKNHGEPKALKNASDNGQDPKGADVYLWGHWWCCKDCCEAMVRAGVVKVVLLEGAKDKFK